VNTAAQVKTSGFSIGVPAAALELRLPSYRSVPLPGLSSDSTDRLISAHRSGQTGAPLPGIETALPQQVGMAARRSDAALFQDDDPVSPEHGRQAMGDGR
jgi:hypothetical protein